MKKRILSFLLCLCMMLAILPVTAFAETGKTVSFTVTADKTEAQPGDTITFTLTMGPVKGFYYADLNLRIPEGLTYVAGSGSITEGLKDKLKAGQIQFLESHGNILGLHGCDYTSTADTVLMTFQCTVNDDAATGAKTVGADLYVDDETNCFDVDMDLIAASFTPAAVTVSEASAPAFAITYDGGENSQGSIAPGTKTPGVAFTLSRDTFTRDGYIQTGWQDKEGNWYDLGGTYTLDEDMTFYPVWDEILTFSVPFTTTVELGDVGIPGEKSFTLAVIGDSAPDMDKSNVTITGSVTTNGKGSYNGTLTITGPERTLWYMLSEGAFVQQVDDGEAGWTVDDTVWGLLMQDDGDAAETGYTVYVVPAMCDDTGNYYINWNSIDWENLQSEDMRFTNTYTAHANTLNLNADTPATGDNSHMALWIALLFASGAGVIGTTVYGKKKRAK